MVKGCFSHFITFSRMRSRVTQANLACLLPAYPASECQQYVHSSHSCCVALGFAGEEALEMFFGKIRSMLKRQFHCSKQYLGGMRLKHGKKIFSLFIILLKYLLDSLNKQGFMLRESWSVTALRNSSLM